MGNTRKRKPTSGQLYDDDGENRRTFYWPFKWFHRSLDFLGDPRSRWQSISKQLNYLIIHLNHTLFLSLLPLQIDFDSSPIFRTHFNCGESVTSICVCRGGTLLLCSTFTGFIFALTRNDTPKVILSTGNEDDAATGRAMAGVMSRENEMKIDNLKSEINTLEKRLIREKENYQEMISSFSNQKTYDKSNLSALPYFAVDDSMILHDGN